LSDGGRMLGGCGAARGSAVVVPNASQPAPRCKNVVEGRGALASRSVSYRGVARQDELASGLESEGARTGTVDL